MLLAMALVLVFTGCAGLGVSMDSNEMGKLDEQSRESIEKTFPLPEQVVLESHEGYDLRFETNLSIDEVVAFYRNAYEQRGYVEERSLVMSEQVALLFKQDGEKDVLLNVSQDGQGSDVRLRLK